MKELQAWREFYIKTQGGYPGYNAASAAIRDDPKLGNAKRYIPGVSHPSRKLLT